MRPRPFLLLLAGVALALMAALHSGFLGSATAEPEDSLVGYWQFDEGEGNTTADGSGNGNNGTLQNGPLWVDGIDGGALEFDGEDDYVETEGNELAITGDITVSVWVKVDSWSDWVNAIVSRESERRGYVLNVYSGSFEFAVGDGNDILTARNSDTIQTDVWYLVTGTWSSSDETIRLYENGHLVATESQDGLTSSIHSYLRIGLDTLETENSRFFDGTIDEVTIWNRTLSSDEILDLYNGSYNPPCQNGDLKLADDGLNQCVCAEGEWICTDVVCDDCEDGGQGLPSISLIPALISIGLIAILRRK